MLLCLLSYFPSFCKKSLIRMNEPAITFRRVQRSFECMDLPANAGPNDLSFVKFFLNSTSRSYYHCFRYKALFPPHDLMVLFHSRKPVNGCQCSLIPLISLWLICFLLLGFPRYRLFYIQPPFFALSGKIPHLGEIIVFESNYCSFTGSCS